MSGCIDLSTVTDPTDFKGTSIPKLFEVDSLLRCHICKEFLSSPMLTSCGHTFCSGCIRKYLLNTPKCPICSKELRESNLSRNIILEQLVISYKSLRNDLLKSIQLPKVSTTEINERKPLKLKDLPTSSIDTIPEVIDLENDSNFDDSLDDELMILVETKKRKQPMKIDSILKKPKPMVQKRIITETGSCPICSKVFPIEILQGRHIDECLSEAHLEPTKSNSSSPRVRNLKTFENNGTICQLSHFQPKEVTNSHQKLTKLDYSSLSTTQLKSKLSRLELKTSGTRNELEARYNEYLILWNANCDSVQPKNPKLLRSQLAKWESAIKVKSDGPDQLDKDGWRSLIQQARDTIKNKGPN